MRTGSKLGRGRLWLCAGVFVLGCAAAPEPRQGGPGAGQRPAIAREWHGVVRTPQADAYEAYLGEAIRGFVNIPGNRGYQMWRDARGELTDFTVVSFWDSREAIKAYAGEDIACVHPLPRDPEFLVDPEPLVRNHEIRAAVP